jgi:ribosomal protein L12E/L44/L45/RPP1/RPP2
MLVLKGPVIAKQITYPFTSRHTLTVTSASSEADEDDDEEEEDDDDEEEEEEEELFLGSGPLDIVS